VKRVQPACWRHWLALLCCFYIEIGNLSPISNPAVPTIENMKSWSLVWFAYFCCFSSGILGLNNTKSGTRYNEAFCIEEYEFQFFLVIPSKTAEHNPAIAKQIKPEKAKIKLMFKI
jgi:hypothetical protein